MNRAADLIQLATSKAVKERLDNLDIPFESLGFDRFGISRRHLGLFYTLLEPLYRHYFRVEVNGLEHIPTTGRGMLIGNHSGGIPVDAGMIFASIFFELDPPRHVHVLLH